MVPGVVLAEVAGYLLAAALAELAASQQSVASVGVENQDRAPFVLSVSPSRFFLKRKPLVRYSCGIGSQSESEVAI